VSALAAPGLPSHPEHALGRSFALALLVHLVLAAVITLGVRWQSHPPETVTVELWEPPAPRPAPPVEAPPPKPQPEAKPAIKKPDIVEKAVPKPKPKPEAKKPEPKKVEAKPKPIPGFDKRLREQMAAEQKALAIERQERDLRALLARQQADARNKALALWRDRIRSKIRSNIIVPHDLAGNPEAIFDVALLPTGEVLTVRKRKSSGHTGYDTAVERAILKSSPLPKPDDMSVFDRLLELSFRPQDQR
jgi:colicin import membrane protein